MPDIISKSIVTPLDLLAASNKALTAKRLAVTGSNLAAATRYVQTLNLGAIGNPSSVLLLTMLAQAPSNNFGPIGWAGANVIVYPDAALAFAPGINNTNNQVLAAGMLLVSEDHTIARRFTWPESGSNANREVYGATPTTLPFGNTYASIGIGVLFGFYSTNGVFGCGKKVQIESVWLTQSGANTTLNIAFYNNDAAAPADFVVGLIVYPAS